MKKFLYLNIFKQIFLKFEFKWISHPNEIQTNKLNVINKKKIIWTFSSKHYFKFSVEICV